jgi:hypothetical protein
MDFTNLLVVLVCTLVGFNALSFLELRRIRKLATPVARKPETGSAVSG